MLRLSDDPTRQRIAGGVGEVEPAPTGERVDRLEDRPAGGGDRFDAALEILGVEDHQRPAGPNLGGGRSKESLPRALAGLGGVEDGFDRAAEPLASSAAVGLRPRSVVSWSRSRSMRIARSWRSRGGADRPGEVAEVASDLALDGGHRVEANGGAVVGVKPVRCLDQTERGDLLQVLETALNSPVAGSRGEDVA